MKNYCIIFCWILFGFYAPLKAQDFNPKSSAAIYQDIQKLNFLGNVLYVAAHPDDENTRLISYLSNHTHATTSYLSLTRGDGGQNLIGTEIRALLGVLRTQELLAARAIDGGHQYFTRANDFGFSKHPEETLEIWDKELVLSDVVKTIRNLRPDVIINRFDHRTPGTTHGHHTTSAMLSMEAYELSGTNAYSVPEEKRSPWKPQRIFFNTSWWFYGSQKKFEDAQKEGLATLDVGVYYPLLGVSNNEIAAQASSQHLCQGFGRLNQRGSEKEYLELLKGTPIKDNNIFSGIDTSWNRIPEGKAILKILAPIQAQFNFKNPSAHLKNLVNAYQLIQQIEDAFWREQKTAQIKEIIKDISGLHLAFLSKEAYGNPGKKITAQLEVLARNTPDVLFKKLRIKGAKAAGKDQEQLLKINEKITENLLLTLADNSDYSNPYWLNELPSLGMYRVTNSELIGLPESPASVTANITLDFYGTSISYNLPLVYRYAKPDKGELWERFRILPEVSIEQDKEVVLFPETVAKEVAVQITALHDNFEGKIKLLLPAHWKVTPAYQNVSIKLKGASRRITFKVTPPREDSQVTGNFQVTTSTKAYDQKVVSIAYDHIPTQVVLEKSSTKFVRLNIQKRGSHIGYIMGAGDKIPESLEAIGYTVHLLDPDKLEITDLSKYQSIILGIRALNVIEGLDLKKNTLQEYVKQGGVLIGQYNTAQRNSNNLFSLSPYPLYLSRDRVTRENAPVKLLAPEHPILSYPNKITTVDFKGWVQERGLYFPNKWDPSFSPILEMQDGAEKPTKGSLLVAPYGKGHFIYTGLSFFRELPAGVPGAYRLFSNMISLPQNIENITLKN